MVFAPLNNASLVLLSSLLLFCLLLSILSLSHFLVLAVFALLRVMKSQWKMQSALALLKKPLVFHVIREIFLLIQLVMNTTTFRDKEFEDTSSITRFIVYYAVGVFYRLTIVLTPVSLSVYLKLIWDCLRK